VDLPDSSRRDPTWFRSNHARYGRDGCRVPLPWEAAKPGYGFSPSGASWLPQPADWACFARDAQLGAADSTLELYRSALALRREHALGEGGLTWLEDKGRDVIAFRNGSVQVIVNLGARSLTLPQGDILLCSEPFEGMTLPSDTAVWLRA
jgi:alpha-glucosidase